MKYWHEPKNDLEVGRANAGPWATTHLTISLQCLCSTSCFLTLDFVLAYVVQLLIVVLVVLPDTLLCAFRLNIWSPISQEVTPGAPLWSLGLDFVRPVVFSGGLPCGQ